MNRKAFDHAVRAAGGVLGEDEVLIIGSQALHASVPGRVPDEAERSVEADVAALVDPDDRKADLIDGSIGEASMFHDTFGYYAQGMSEAAATLPTGWRERLIRYETPATNGVVAWCLEIHDLWLAKAAALRSKDVEFCSALLRDHLVEPKILTDRLGTMDGVADVRRQQIAALIQRPSAPG